LSKLQQFLLVVGLVTGIGTWYYSYAVFIPDWKAHEAPGLTWTNRSDLYPRWVGTRELLLRHRNPYSPQVTRDIQIGYYGRPVGEGYTADPQGFAYPLYVAWFIAPTVWASFSVVSATFTFLLLLAATLSVPLWCGAAGVRCNWSTLLLAVIFTLGSWPVVQGIAVQQLTLFVALLLAGALAAIARQKLWLTGVLLALATIKPQLSLPLVAWITVWVISSWRKRQALFWSFAASMTVLVLSGEALLLGWLWKWKASWGLYLQGTGSKLDLQRLLGDQWGMFATVGLVVIVAAICVRRRKYEAGSTSLAYCNALVMAATLAVFPTWSLAGYNQVLLLPAVLWMILACRPGPTKRPLVSILRWAGIAAVFWPTLAASGLSVAHLLSYPAAFSHDTILQLPSYDYLVVPLLLVAALIADLPASATSLVSERAGTGKIRPSR
jgi:hypothetical protein